jgi:hypothetical protein
MSDLPKEMECVVGFFIVVFSGVLGFVSGYVVGLLLRK